MNKKILIIIMFLPLLLTNCGNNSKPTILVDIKIAESNSEVSNDDSAIHNVLAINEAYQLVSIEVLSNQPIARDNFMEVTDKMDHYSAYIQNLFIKLSNDGIIDGEGKYLESGVIGNIIVTLENSHSKIQLWMKLNSSNEVGLEYLIYDLSNNVEESHKFDFAYKEELNGISDVMNDPILIF